MTTRKSIWIKPQLLLLGVPSFSSRCILSSSPDWPSALKYVGFLDSTCYSEPAGSTKIQDPAQRRFFSEALPSPSYHKLTCSHPPWGHKYPGFCHTRWQMLIDTALKMRTLGAGPCWIHVCLISGLQEGAQQHSSARIQCMNSDNSHKWL